MMARRVGDGASWVWCLVATAAQAQSFPDQSGPHHRPVSGRRFGGQHFARGAPRLSAIWGQPIVIENRAGGATQIAADMVAKSAPDGYTLFATGMETFAINPYMMSKLSYDVKRFHRRSAATACRTRFWSCRRPRPSSRSPS